MRSKFKWIFTLLVAFTMQFSFAQEKTVTGVVTDATGPVYGANVVVKGTAKGVQTDLNGKYAIKASVGQTLVFSFIGSTDESRVVGSSNNINVKLSEVKTKIEEIVIDGYKATTRKKSSIAQTTISSEIIEGRPNVSFLQSLQGQAAGLSISTSSGSPGSAKIDALLRGTSSLQGSTDPLYVIDGVATNQSVFRGLNSEDIESLTVLKDAGATAIYGNRGASGVIVIKTRKGSFNSKMKFNYTSSMGFTTLQKNDYNITNTKEILTLERTMSVGLGGNNPVTSLPFTDDEINKFPIDTNWKDYFFRTGTSKNQNLSFSTGSDKMSNYTSLGYFDQQGIVPNTDFKRFSLRSNFTGKSSNDRFTYTTNFSGAFSKRSQLDQETRTDINANVLQNPLQGLLTSLPYLDPRTYQNGAQLFADFGAPSFQITPFMLMDYLVPGNIPSGFNETKLLANFNGNFKLTKDLTYSLTTGVDYTQNDRDFARAPQSYLAIVATPAGAEFGGVETQSIDKDFGYSAVSKLNYLKKIKEKHTIDANLFLEYDKFHRTFYSYSQNGLDPRTWSLGTGTGYIPFNTATPTFYRPTVSALKRDAGLFSYFGTVDYDYNSRFGAVATLRRDASYRFIDDKRWGTFWSVSGRWNLDTEKFLENSIFNELKLRASYGTTGNQYIQAGSAGVNVNYLAPNLVRDLNSSQSGYGNAASLGIANIGNNDLQWEVTTQANIGVDFSIKKKLSGSLDVYNKKTDHLFDVYDTSAIVGTYGINGNSDDRVLYNKGVELKLNYEIINKNEFKLNVFANASYNKNQIEGLKYADGEDRLPVGTNFAWQNGGTLDEYNVVPYVGVNPDNGNLLFLDKDNNVTETPTDEDRRMTGKTYVPVYQGGFGFNASYKGFYLTSNFSFAADVYRFDFDLTNLSDPTSIGVFPVTNDLLDAWTPNNHTDYPSLTATNLNEGDALSDRWLRDASYIRLKTLNFGYQVPKKFLDNTFMTGVRLYSQLENYLTWTKWRGFDADAGLNSSNQGGYPSPKVVSFGVDIQF